MGSKTVDRQFIRVEVGQEFLRLYKLHGDEFLLSIITGDKTWMQMGGKRFSTNEKAEKWMKLLVGNYLEKGIKLLIPQSTTCIERNGDCRKIAYVCTNVTR